MDKICQGVNIYVGCRLHSFSRGGATDAATAGLMDWELGLWSSDAYQQYIQTPTSVMVNFASRIAIPKSASQIGSLVI